MTTHIMFDLETWGASPGCVIVSIGAVVFDIETGAIGEEFYTAIDPQSCIDRGLTVSADTIKWWMSQSAEAISATHPPSPYAAHIVNALEDFEQFVRGYTDIRVWSNGPSFDAAILEYAYAKIMKYKSNTLWAYNVQRCQPTIVELSGLDRDTIPFEGERHNALADAKHQAKIVHAAYKLLKSQ